MPGFPRSNSDGASSSKVAPVPAHFSVNQEAEAITAVNGQPAVGVATIPTPFEAVKKISWLAMPMALSYTFSFSIVALGIMAGRIKSEEDNQDYIGAAALCATIVNTVLVMAFSGLYSVSILTSKNRGKLKELQDNAGEQRVAEDEESLPNENQALAEVKQDVSNVLKDSNIISLPLALPPFFILYYSSALLQAVGQSARVAALAQSYLRPYSLATLPVLIRLGEEQICFSFEKQIPVMLIGLSTFSLGVLLANILCFGRFSAPQLDLAGIAYGFVTEAYLIMGVLAVYLSKAKIFNEFNFFRNFSFTRKDWQQIKDLCKIGWPIALTMTMEISATLVTSLFAGWLGSDALTAYSFWAQFYFFVFIPLIALGQATSQEVSRLLGETNKSLGIPRIAKYGLLASEGIIMPLCILVSAYPELLKYVITDQDISDEIMHTVRILMPVTAIGIIFDTAKYNMLQVLRALGDHIVPTSLSISTTWLGVLLAYVLGFHTSLGIVGVGAGYAAGLAAGALALVPRWLKNISTYERADIIELPTETTPLLPQSRLTLTQ